MKGSIYFFISWKQLFTTKEYIYRHKTYRVTYPSGADIIQESSSLVRKHIKLYNAPCLDSCPPPPRQPSASCINSLTQIRCIRLGQYHDCIATVRVFILFILWLLYGSLPQWCLQTYLLNRSVHVVYVYLKIFILP